MRSLPFVSLMAAFGLIAASNSEISVLNYINQYNGIAVEEMHRTGIPASITLGQGILESRWGTSQLARESNNHFGIKCKGDWTGDTYYAKDDDYENGQLVASCFRAYESPEVSYLDHSEFLMSNSRYQPLFQLSKTDYKGWAKGLKKCGYATDKNYAKNLIATIEKYQLQRFDYTSIEVLAQETISPPPVELLSDVISQTTAHQPPPATFLIPDDYQRGDGLKVVRAIEQNNFYQDVYGRSSENYLDVIIPHTTIRD